MHMLRPQIEPIGLTNLFYLATKCSFAIPNISRNAYNVSALIISCLKKFPDTALTQNARVMACTGPFSIDVQKISYFK